MKRNLIWLAASLAAFGAGMASAQTYQAYPTNQAYGSGNSYGQDILVRCESINSRQQTCRVDNAREVRLVRQLSRENCVQGRNWDFNQTAIRVDDGCRAEFRVTRNQRWNDNGNRHGNDGRYGNDNRYGNNGQVLCESHTYQRTYCGDATSNYQVLGYRSQNCVQNRTFGQDSRGLWVSGYCRMSFQRTGRDDRHGNRDGYGHDDRRRDGVATSVRCESNSSGRTYCGDAQSRWVLRDTRTTNCIEGRTWGTDQRGLWVSNGCRGDFDRRMRYDEPRNDTFPNAYQGNERTYRD